MTPRDHGGGLDAAIAKFGGHRADWLDLSTGINPVPYPIGDLPAHVWTALPDQSAIARLVQAARLFWNVPADAHLVAAPGASALIARIPEITATRTAHIPAPTYNEHRAAFGGDPNTGPEAPVHVYVHPNNPDGHLWPADVIRSRHLTVIDESFCDTCPARSHIAHTTRDDTLVLKSFGKFWGLAGLRLGFAIGHTKNLTDLLGPWAVSGPALHIGAQALEDHTWATQTRARLTQDAAHLDNLMTKAGANPIGGTPLFRLYDVPDAQRWYDDLAQNHILSRIFPYSSTWLRLGLPHPDRINQLATALRGMAGGATT